MLTLTGTDTLAHYQQVLDSVTYASTSDNPTNFGTDPSRTISWVVNDGTLNNSATQTTTLSIAAVGRRAGARQRGGECVLSPRMRAPVTLSPAATVSDVDSQTLRRRRCRSAAGFSRRRAGGDDGRHQHHGELQRGDRGADADRHRHAGALPAGARQRHLRHDQRQPDQLRRADRAGRSVDGQRRQRSATARPRPRRSASRRSNDAPVLSNVAATATYTENAAPADAVAGCDGERRRQPEPASATVSITGGLLDGDVLAATTAGTSITANYNAATGVLTLTGSDTLAHYQQVLDSVTYVSTSDNPTNFGTEPAGRSRGLSTTARSTTARPRPPPLTRRGG